MLVLASFSSSATLFTFARVYNAVVGGDKCDACGAAGSVARGVCRDISRRSVVRTAAEIFSRVQVVCSCGRGWVWDECNNEDRRYLSSIIAYGGASAVS